MTLTAERDEESLRAGLERWLGRRVGEISRASPGFSCETILVEREIVVRLPPVGEGIFPIFDLALQAAVQNKAATAGVPVATPLEYVDDESYFGTGFVAMRFVDGAIPAQFTVGDEWLRSLDSDVVRHTLWQSFLETIVQIHEVPVDGLDLRRGLEAELDFWDRYVQWATDGAPPSVLADALAWCRTNRPELEPSGGLLWGDVRLGNVVFDRSSVLPKAVLDWDMVSWGPIEMDLAWFVALERLQTDFTGLAVSGFGSREEAVALVEGGVGRQLLDLSWYEVFALTRAGAVSTRIAILFQRAGRKGPFGVENDPTLVAAAALIDSL